MLGVMSLAFSKYLNVYDYLFYRMSISGGTERDNSRNALIIILSLFIINIYTLLKIADFLFHKQFINYFSSFSDATDFYPITSFVIWLIILLIIDWLTIKFKILDNLKEKFKDETAAQKRYGKIYLYCYLAISFLGVFMYWEVRDIYFNGN